MVTETDYLSEAKKSFCRVVCSTLVENEYNETLVVNYESLASERFHDSFFLQILAHNHMFLSMQYHVLRVKTANMSQSSAHPHQGRPRPDSQTIQHVSNVLRDSQEYDNFTGLYCVVYAYIRTITIF